MNYFRYDDINSSDFNVFISGEATYKTPARDVETIEIPGKNGTLSIDNKRFYNVPIIYPSFIVQDFRANYTALKAQMMSKSGYKKLTDTYDPEHYRKARFNSEITPEMDQLNRHGKFELVFDCDPRRFLKSGERATTFMSAGAIKNPSVYSALPLMRVYGAGTVAINGISFTITNASEYTDIDCELQECYKDTLATNCNGNVVVSKFPTLISGENSVSMSGITKLEITPRWWRL